MVLVCVCVRVLCIYHVDCVADNFGGVYSLFPHVFQGFRLSTHTHIALPTETPPWPTLIRFCPLQYVYLMRASDLYIACKVKTLGHKVILGPDLNHITSPQLLLPHLSSLFSFLPQGLCTEDSMCLDCSLTTPGPLYSCFHSSLSFPPPLMLGTCNTLFYSACDAVGTQ